MKQNLFSSQATTFTINATATASVAAQMPIVANNIRITNEGPNVAFIAISTSNSVTATLPGALPVTPGTNQTCTPVLAGSDITLSMAVSGVPNYISAVCRAGGTATVNFQPGEGE